MSHNSLVCTMGWHQWAIANYGVVMIDSAINHNYGDVMALLPSIVLQMAQKLRLQKNIPKTIENIMKYA